ncbi:MAG: RtcB family protein [Deltaproteobacteria bacterium]|nr:RtcB family protein [Deltaproteobacteria bacterium]
MRVFSGGRVPIRVWARHLDDAALQQLRALADQPWVHEAVCAMPDVHVSHGVSVGTVFATRDVVVPSALGGDLGCGIAAACVPGAAAGVDLRAVLDRLAEVVPVGDAVHRSRELAPRARRLDPLPEHLAEAPLSTRALARTRDAIGARHLGTLGGGNHFLELDRDVDGDLWILVHSGSRGIGAAIAEHHRRVGEVLAIDRDEGRLYLRDLELALAFAAENRRRLLRAALDVLGAAGEAIVDVHHNHVARDGERLVHRKGAIAAPAGARAIIPGSMATASYVVEGRGEPLSFASASHGAGRVMTRTQARRTLRRDAVDRALRRVVWRAESDVREEAPQVYRDIGEVLEDQADLVTPLLRLEPLAVLKG